MCFNQTQQKYEYSLRKTYLVTQLCIGSPAIAFFKRHL